MYYKDANFEVFKKIAGYHEYCTNVVGAFDIETSEYETNNEKFTFMYLWQFALNEMAVHGRTWNECVDCLSKLRDELGLKIDHRLVVYVHNLSYEFTFMQHIDGIYFTVESDYDFIAREQHDIIKLIVNDVFEFRDSNAYLEMSLAKLGEMISLPKLELDYSVVRTSSTVLDKHTIEYGERDVLILTKFFLAESKNYGSIGKMPLTLSRKVKRLIQANVRDFGTYAVAKSQNDHALDVLQKLIAAYCPPFSYSQSVYNDIVVDDVSHDDISSFYPAIMCFEKFPSGKFERVDVIPESIEDVITMYKYKPFIIQLSITKLKNKYPRFAYLSRNPEWRMLNVKYLDHRVLSADAAIVTVTDIDFRNILQYYTYDKIDILEICAAKRYVWLPEYISRTVVQLYNDKRIAKKHIKNIQNVERREPTLQEYADYERIKSMVDRISGIFVQRPLKFVYTINTDTHDIVRSDEEMYIASESDLFVNYAWGVWLTAYARDLMSKIFSAANLELDDGKYLNNDNIMYSDTDSVNYQSTNTSVTNIIADYNNNVNEKLKKFCNRHPDFAFYDDLQELGKFDRQHYKKFKCCQLKRYAYVTDNDDFVTVVAGLSRDNTYFLQFKTIDEKFEAFNNEMKILSEHSNVKKHEFKHKHIECDVVDCNNDVKHIVVDDCVVINKNDFNCKNDGYDVTQAMLQRIQQRKPLTRRKKLK